MSASRFFLLVLVMLPFLLVPEASAFAEEIRVCYDYQCNAEATVQLTLQHRRELERVLRYSTTAQSERELLGWAIGKLYLIAGMQTPVWRDRGGNLNDDRDNPGAMDCIDHSTNTTAFLNWMAANRLLKYHRVGGILERGHFLSYHRSASIVDMETENMYAIDSWFVDNGRTVPVFKAEDWINGARFE